MLAHNVYFCLNDNSAAATEKLLAGPAPTEPVWLNERD